MIAISKILVPTDFSEPSEVALRYGKELAAGFNASLHVMHVVEDSALFAYASIEGSAPLGYNLLEDMTTQARKRLDEVLSAAEREALKAELVVVNGSPFVEIVRYARDRQVDLIVMATHGRGAIAHMLMGSVAEKVVRKAPCPVLTVRHPEHEFVMP